MRTDELVRALAADRHDDRPLWLRVGGALVVGLAVAAVLFMLTLRPRADVAAAMHDPRFNFKFAITLTLAFAAGGLLLRLARPGARRGWWAAALLLVPALLMLDFAYEFMMLQPAMPMMTRLIGKNWMFCLPSIPMLAAPILIALLLALRNGAPTRPALAGAVAGLVAGGLGAALYASHCTDDSPLFVTTWYSIAIAFVTAVGFFAGRRLLRW
jgi:hypothetical protein